MIPHNNLNDKIATLNTMLDEYIVWFAGITSHVVSKDEIPASPVVFIKWAQNLDLEGINIDGQYTKTNTDLQRRHAELIKAAVALQADNFSTFAQSMQKFITDLRDFCQKIAMEQWGLDVLTGMKNNAIVKKDLAIEMDRLSREGYPFCIGTARIDNFEAIQNALGREKTDALIKTVATLVQKCLRTYDEAYRNSRDHFIMCIKQSDIIGGQKALERLRDILEEAGEFYEIDGQKKPLSLSCCVASPLPGDDIEDLLDNLSVDLDEQIKDQGSVLTYQEMSPLQRFIQKEKD